MRRARGTASPLVEMPAACRPGARRGGTCYTVSVALCNQEPQNVAWPPSIRVCRLPSGVPPGRHRSCWPPPGLRAPCAEECSRCLNRAVAELQARRPLVRCLPAKMSKATGRAGASTGRRQSSIDRRTLSITVVSSSRSALCPQRRCGVAWPPRARACSACVQCIRLPSRQCESSSSAAPSLISRACSHTRARLPP